MAARVAYWNNYVLSLVGPNAPNVPPNPLPTIDTPVLIPDPNVPYYFNGPMPVRDATNTLANLDAIRARSRSLGWIRFDGSTKQSWQCEL